MREKNQLLTEQQKRKNYDHEKYKPKKKGQKKADEAGPQARAITERVERDTLSQELAREKLLLY